MSEIADQVKSFSEEKIIDFEQISAENNALPNPHQVKEIFEDFRNRLMNSSPNSKVENE